MKVYPKTIAILLGLGLIGMSSSAFANHTSWTINTTDTYHLVNYSSYPITYGIGTIYDNTGDAKTANGGTDASDWVKSITVTQDPGNPADKTKHGITGEILPDVNNIPNGVNIAVTGVYYRDKPKGAGSHYHGPKYQMSFSWPGGGAYFLYNGSANEEPKLTTTFAPIVLPGNPSNINNAVTACISNAPNLTANGKTIYGSKGDPVNYSMTTTIAFYNKSANHQCS